MDKSEEARWDKLVSQPDWYVKHWREIWAISKLESGHPRKVAARMYFEDRLKTGRIALADHGDNLDIQRLPIDTIVIHHTSNMVPYTLDKMNAVQLLNVYVPYYLNPRVKGEEHLKNQPIWSNHIIEGKQVFYAYHWFVRMDGSVERLLTDDQIGWHAGNWDINCRSVAICLDNDFSNQDPSPVVLRAVAKIIEEHYSGVQADRVLGHREVNDKTTCPGGNFLGGWKQQLIDLI